ALATLAGAGAALAGPAGLEARMEGVLSAKRLGKARAGVLVVDSETGKVLFERRADERFATASNTKLVTTAAALALLGPSYTFTTGFFRGGSIESGALAGDLVVVGGGAPAISGRFHGGRSTAVFEEVAQKLLEQGVRRIDGDVVLDDRAFDREFVARGWPKD